MWREELKYIDWGADFYPIWGLAFYLGLVLFARQNDKVAVSAMEINGPDNSTFNITLKPKNI